MMLTLVFIYIYIYIAIFVFVFVFFQARLNAIKIENKLQEGGSAQQQSFKLRIQCLKKKKKKKKKTNNWKWIIECFLNKKPKKRVALRGGF
jgi:hypothetical protein